MLRPIPAALGLALLLAAGCVPTVVVEDNIDLDFDFVELLGPSNELHSPYVVGASLNLYIHSTDRDQKMVNWTVESSNPAVFAVDAPARDNANAFLYVPCHALSDGTATLIVRDASKQEQARTTVEARVPDRVQLMAHGLLIIRRTEAEATVSDARLLHGGTATFLVHYFKGGTPLYGNGALSVDAPTGVVATTPSTFLFEARDWLQVTPSMVGTSTLALKTGGVHAADVPLVVVDQSEVASMRILGMDESHAATGAHLVALAQAYDSASRPIYGVDYKWQLDGTTQAGLGDLFRYTFDPKKPKMLSAAFGTMNAAAMIHTAMGFVDSSNHIGCSAVPGAPLTGVPWLLLLLLLSWGAAICRSYPLRMSRYMRQLLLSGSSASTASHSTRASSLRPSE